MGSQGLSVPAVGGDVEDGPEEGREERSETDPAGGPEGQGQQGGRTRTLTATTTTATTTTTTAANVIPVADDLARPAAAPRPRPLAALYPLVLGAADAFAMAAAVAVAASTATGTVPAAAAIVALNAASGLHRSRRRPSLLDDAPALALRAALVAAPAALLLPGPGGIRTWFWITFLYCAFAGAARLAAGTGLRTYRKLRPRGRPTIIVGTGPGAWHVTGLLRRRRDFGLDPVGQIVTGDPGDQPVPALPVLGRPLDLRRALAACTETRSRAAVVIVSDELRRSRLDALVRVCAALPCETLLVPSTTDLLLARAGARTARAPVEHLEGVPCVRLGPRPGERAARAAKRAFDVIAAILLLLALWPVLLACALAVRIEGGPGVLFRQRRVGLDGRHFTLLKFRSLRPADDLEADTRWSVDGDARMGPVGRFLRETSLDELPQLWNVVRGDMSLVGPRPERPHFVRLFSETCPEYPLRHRMPVGITGWAQVNGLRGDTSIELRVRLDNRYIDTWTFGADLRILLMTVRAVLTRNVA
ncbi:exopolysaccharide biosynthesis polyprenyl glycosylphosphotransferase [Spirillospora sp. CA-255316]